MSGHTSIAYMQILTIDRSEEVRLQAADELRAHVSTDISVLAGCAQLTQFQVTSYSQEYPGHDGLKGVWGDVFHRTFDLTRSNSTYERLGACAAIGTYTVSRADLG